MAESRGDNVDWTQAYNLFKLGLRRAGLDKLKSQYPPAILFASDDIDELVLSDAQREGGAYWDETVTAHGCFLLADDKEIGTTMMAVSHIQQTLLKAANCGVRTRFLIVVPKALLDEWEDALGLCSSIKVLRYHGSTETDYNKQQMETYDVILTTYDVVTKQYRAPFAPLFAIDFEEVILDEAHAIKNVDTMRARAVEQVRARLRSCITSVPLQNEYWDIYSLLKFMRLKPFSQVDFFKFAFVNSERMRQHGQRLNTESELILAAIMSSVSLRRRKIDDFNGRAINSTQEWREIHHLVPLCAEDQKAQMPTEPLWDHFVKVANERMRKQTFDAIDLHKAEKEENHIFSLMYQARADAVHPSLKQAKYGDHGKTELEGRIGSDITYEYNQGTSMDAIYSHDDGIDPITPEDNNFEYIRSAVHFGTNREQFRTHMSEGDNWHSDKMIAIVWTLLDIQNKIERECINMTTNSQRKEYRARNKQIVVCEWLAGLDILEIGIKMELGQTCLRIDGQCSSSERERIRSLFEEEEPGLSVRVAKDFKNHFTHPDEHQILLATTNSLGGMRLIHARHVLIVNPHWNPFVEDREIGRAATVGQPGQVVAYKFYMDRSIEQRFGDVQAAKRQLVSGMWDQKMLKTEVSRLDEWSLETFKRKLGA